jgi:uncharacterized membrane protein YphA (DoxX/SURF4 family)
MKKIVNWIFDSPQTGSAYNLLIRIMTGSVFFWEGVLKFVYVNQGIGRFTKLGIPKLAPIIAVIEIVGGLFLMLGLFSRITGIVFVGEMLVAIVLTKVSLYLGTSPLPLPCVPPTEGIWAFLHEVRTDYLLLITSFLIALEGPGNWSLDYKFKFRNKYSTTL